MRNHLIAELEKLAEKDSSVYLLTGDLGFGLLDRFAEKYPNRFINAGISEQNMAAVAAGMALEGNKVYMYSIGNFPGMRCLEQIRNDICYHNANVKIIVVGGGFAYGQLGMSHHATEDIAIMRSLPNMQVFSPADAIEAVQVLQYADSMNGPCYIRLGKGGEPNISPSLSEYSVDKALELKKGREAAIIATGSIIGEAIKAIEVLEEKRVQVGLYNFMTIKPIDKDAIRKIFSKYKLVVTLEEHNIIGGLGGAIAEEMSSIKGRKAILMRMGLKDVYTSVVGEQSFLRDYYGMSARHIVMAIIKELEFL